MMNTPATTIFDEACATISAQIDALDSPDELTPEQLLEFQARSEIIKVLCEQLGHSEAEKQLLENAALLENVA